MPTISERICLYINYNVFDSFFPTPKNGTCGFLYPTAEKCRKRCGECVKKDAAKCGVFFSESMGVLFNRDIDENFFAFIKFKAHFLLVKGFFGFRKPFVKNFFPKFAEDGLQYVFDYAAGRYKKETMSEFQNLFMRVVSAIVNANTDSYTFEQIKKDVLGKTGLMPKIKDIFAKKK